MDEISLNGENYIKSNIIARELGYTNDYVGQLCRAGKVKSALIGRSWYVLESSIREHKKVRYRRTNIKNREEVRKALHEVRKSEEKIRHLSVSGSNFLHRSPQTNIEYVQDSSELVPILVEKDKSRVEKTGVTLEIIPAGAEKLKIKSEDKAYKVTRTELPVFTLKGSLKVREHSEANLLVKEETAESTKPGKLKLELKKEVRQGKNKAVHIRAEEIGEAIEFVPLHTQNITVTRPYRLWYVAVEFSLVIVLAATASLVLFVTESRYEMSQDSITERFRFNLSAGFESLKYLYK